MQMSSSQFWLAGFVSGLSILPSFHSRFALDLTFVRQSSFPQFMIINVRNRILDRDMLIPILRFPFNSFGTP